MTNRTAYYWVSYTLLLLPLLLFSFKWVQQPTSFEDVYPQQSYLLTYEFDLSNLPENSYVKACLLYTSDAADE